MTLQRQIAARLVEICLESGSFDRVPDGFGVGDIGDLNLSESGLFDSMSMMFLQVEIESEWGVLIPDSQFAAWLRTLNQIAGHIAERLPSSGSTLETGMAEVRVLLRDGQP